MFVVPVPFRVALTDRTRQHNYQIITRNDNITQTRNHKIRQDKTKLDAQPQDKTPGHSNKRQDKKKPILLVQKTH